MPIKFQPSTKVRDKATQQTKTVHYYMKSTPTAELHKYLESSSAKPKVMQKVRNELVRRGAY